MNDLTVTANKIINAPVGKVFDAWLDPALLTQFILPMPGMPQSHVENDPQQGGRFTIIMQVGEDKIPHTGEYLEICRPDKLVFSWHSPFSVDGSKVTLLFNKIDSETTEVALTHVRFIDEEACSNHQSGWTQILQCLADIVS